MTVEPKAKRTVRGRTRAHRGRSALALVACAAVALACASEGDDAPGATSHDAAGRPPDTGASFVDQGTTEASSTEASTGPTSDSSSQAEASVNDGGVEAEAGQPPAFDRDAVRAIVTKVAEYQLSLYKTTASNDWIDATFYAGLMAAYKTTLKPSLLDAAKRWSASHQWALYSSDTRFADNQTCTQTYLEIYELDAAPANAFMYQTAQAAFDAMIAAPKGGRVDWWWCDALFMAP
ncbi:MAG TPA: glycoside hydrolase family 88 protein, partial [Polyangiaceae bacterium]|nr:glycoside hydrolase family 88 protein [Polyangiaceae bacterium]